MPVGRYLIEWTKEETLTRDLNTRNPLLKAFGRVLKRLAVLKEMARDFYFDVLLSVYLCPACGGRLQMTGQSEASCTCGRIVDPTIEFQRSDCCGAKLVKKIFHYACSSCGKTVPSKFIFDERIFHHHYFKTMMRESREKKRQKREQIRQLLAASQSGPLTIADIPDVHAIPGLETELDNFIGVWRYESADAYFNGDEFRMEEYKSVILERVKGYGILFSAIPSLCQDIRKDLSRRFTTLIYMWQERKVDLTQYTNDILVEKHEIDVEG
jgi:hypothetical protein